MVDYQAEDAKFVGPVVLTGRGAEGTGYVDFQNATGDYIEWTVDVPTAGSYNLSWRYANGLSNRPLELAVNDTTEAASLGFPGTGSWTSWNFVNQLVSLKAGVNTIRLKAIGSSGANFDYLRVTEATPTTPTRSVTISNASVTEGTNSFLVFDVSLSTPSSDAITLDLAAVDGLAKGGLIADFGTNPASGPIDYANQEFEVSRDGGNTWQAATNGTNVTFAANQTTLKVRLAVNNDAVNEGTTAETMTLKVDSVVSGTVNNITDTGTGSIIDNDGTSESNGKPISPLPFTEVRVEGSLSLDFDGTDGGVVDKDGEGTGFTMIDPVSNPGNPSPKLGVVGYWSDKLDVDPVSGVLKITTTNGINYLNSDTQDNALGVGLNVPSQALRLKTTLVDLPKPVGGSAQAGLWFGKAEGGGSGNSEDNYIKLVVISDKSGNYLVEALMEKDGVVVQKQKFDIPDDPSSVGLNLFVNPTAKTVTAQYSVAGGANQTLTTFKTVPDEWFSFDQAGINPEIATRSFGGLFATHRQAASPQVFSFDDFTITEEQATPDPTPTPTPSPSPSGNLPFDRWSIPVNNPTAMAVGPDGRLYVATLFGTIHALTIDPKTRTYTSQVISTIPNSEGGNRLTLGIAVDPDSTADNVILWVSHSNGSVSDGALNSGKVSRLSGPNFTQKTDVVTGLPRAIANHATNNIDFGPDGRLYLWQGGNTGAGSANNAATEFGNRPEQVLSAALLVVDIPKWKANPASFNGNVASPIGEFIDQFYARKAQELGRSYTEVQVYASGLRNTYDGVFHSNGNIYAPDNGLGVTGTVPPVPRLGSPTDRTKTTLFGQVQTDNPGSQSDPLNRIVKGGYYGHPNPYRDEVVFKDGTFQGFTSGTIPAGHPAYQKPFLDLGKNRSANGIIEYTGNNFFGQLKGDLLITNYSTGDNLTRVKLSPDGSSSVGSSSLIGGFVDPLPIAMGPNGSVFVGEFNGNKVTVLEPLGIWRKDLPAAPQAILDAGSATLDDKLYMVGGKTASTHLKSMYVYDPGDPINPADDKWAAGLDLPGPGVENPAVAAVGGKLYVFGGSTDPFSGAVSNAAVYNPDTNPNPSIITPAWTSIAPMLTARGGATAQVINGDIYVIGGMNSSGASVNTVEIYDPETNTWRTGPSLQTRRDNAGSAVIGNKLFVFGGRTRNADGSVVNGTLNTMEIYDPLVGQWSVGASMPTGRRTMSVGTINDRIQVIGGEATSGGSTFVQNEEYNPATNTWRTLPSIPTGRHGAAFGTIDNIAYVVAGGPTAGSAFTTAVEAFTV